MIMLQNLKNRTLKMYKIANSVLTQKKWEVELTVGGEILPEVKISEEIFLG